VAENQGTILVVDDEQGMRDYLSVVLGKEGYHVLCATNGEEALKKFQDTPVDVVITDLKMRGMGGLSLLQEIKNAAPAALVIVMTAFSSWDSAVEAMRLGAYNYIKKPFDNENIKHCVARAVHLHRMYDAAGADDVFKIGNLIGNSAPIQKVQGIIRRIAPTDSTVLIQGPTGTGKELVARALHAGSLRSHEAFIAINCGAFTETLLESELFGHVKGSFTGAIVDKKGLFEVATGGTFFLDEVAEMSKATQVKLLRVLEEQEVKPVGGTKAIIIDVRLIGATNKDLEKEVREGNFREDLFYRLNVIPMLLPALKERREDIPLLVGHFLARQSKALEREATSISNEAMDLLIAYNWPGNIRELDNMIQRAVALCESSTLDVQDLAGKVRTAIPGGKLLSTEIPEGGVDLNSILEDIERKYIVTALENTGYNMTKAARILNMSFRSIRYKVKKLRISTR